MNKLIEVIAPKLSLEKEINAKINSSSFQKIIKEYLTTDRIKLKHLNQNSAELLFEGICIDDCKQIVDRIKGRDNQLAFYSRYNSKLSVIHTETGLKIESHDIYILGTKKEKGMFLSILEARLIHLTNFIAEKTQN